MKTMLCFLLLTEVLVTHIKSYSSFIVTRGFSDTVIFDPGSGSDNCSSIGAYSSLSGKGCICNSRGTYYTAEEGTRCYQDSGKLTGR